MIYINIFEIKMFLTVSSLRTMRSKLNYHQYSHSNYRAFCSIRRALNEKCATTRLGGPNGDFIFQKTLFNCLLSSKRMFRIFKKNDLQMARLMKNRFYSRGRKEEPSDDKNNYFYLVLLVILLYGLVKVTVTEIDWDEFVSDFLMKGEVEKIIILDDKYVEVIVRNGAVIPNRKHITGRRYILPVADVESFEEELREVENTLNIVASDRIPVTFTNSTIQPIIHILITLGVAYLLLRNVRGGSVNSLFQLKSAKYTLIDPFTGGTKGVKFSDVAGLKEAKQEIMEFVDYLKRPEHYQYLGAKVPKGALLLGPPGCGKTLLAKAVASEANVPFLSMNGSEFMEIIGGLGAARVRDLFSEAKNVSPCIIYIDEIDAIGKKRGGTGAYNTSLTESENTLNQLLVEMDGMASREGVITLASTNRADVLDKALLRPGRFDRQIMIDLPTAEERREIFMHYLKRIRLEKAPEVYAKRMASLTPGFSGANIANVCNEAALYAARYKKKVVTGEDLEYAVEKIVGGIEKRSSAIAAEEKHLVAYHEAGRALVGWLSEQGEILLKMSIVPRTNESLGWTHFSQNEQYLFSQEELFNKMCMALGGRAAEAMIFNKISTKSEKDLKKVTKIAYAQVHQFGMNDIVGPISFGDTKEFQRKPYSKQLAALMDAEARKLVSKAFQGADAILRENKNLLVKLAQELLKRETMTYSEVEALIGPPKNSKKKMIEPLVFELSIDLAAAGDSSLANTE